MWCSAVATSISTRCLGALEVVLLLALTGVAAAQPRPMAGGAFEGRTFAAHWARRPLLDAARAAASVDAAWERFGVLGRGATVCVVDTGVDLAHRDLRDASDHTRVDWLLDLDRAPRGAEPALEARFGGAVFRGDELDAMLAAEDPALPTDWHGHGTAVASAAVGDDAPAGMTTPGVLAGVAPEARLVVVRALRRGTPGFADEDIARGAAFCAAVADPPRTVALLSLGGHDGAHDGTSAIEAALAELVRAGLTIVVAAGNDGGGSIHAASRVAAGASAIFTLDVPSPQDAGVAHVAVAVRGATSVALVAPDGARVRVGARGEHARLATRRGTIEIDASREGVVDLVAEGDAALPLLGGRFVIEVGGPAHADAWIVSAELGTTPFAPSFSGANVVHGEEVTMPATADDVVAVGASVSRETLLSTDGSPALTLAADAEGRALFSSRGPSAGGALRPDVLAPGGWLLAARSAAVDPSDPEALVHGHASEWSRLARPDGRLAIAGTSLSAAIVAGALALAVEAAPLDPLRDRDRLAWSATRGDGAAFTPARGFGALDVGAFLDARAAPTGGAASAGSLSTSRWFATPGETELSLALVARASDAVPDDAWVTFSRDGVVVGRAPLRAGIARARVGLGRAAPGSAVSWTAALEDDGRAIAAASTPVAWNDDGTGAIASGGAGCGVARGGGAPASLVLVGLLLARSRTGRSRRARDASTLRT